MTEKSLRVVLAVTHFLPHVRISHLVRMGFLAQSRECPGGVAVGGGVGIGVPRLGLILPQDAITTTTLPAVHHA